MFAQKSYRGYTNRRKFAENLFVLSDEIRRRESIVGSTDVFAFVAFLSGEGQIRSGKQQLGEGGLDPKTAEEIKHPSLPLHSGDFEILKNKERATWITALPSHCRPSSFYLLSWGEIPTPNFCRNVMGIPKR